MPLIFKKHNVTWKKCFTVQILHILLFADNPEQKVKCDKSDGTFM